MDNDALAQLAAQYEAEDEPQEIEAAVEPEIIEEPEEVIEAVEPEIAEEEPEENPPGFIDNMDDWIAAGKDPDAFRGKKAYEAEYQRIQEAKELKSSVQQMKETLKATVDAMARRDEETSARHREELETALATAREDGDTDAALAAQDKLLNMRAPEKAPQENPVVSGFVGNQSALEDPQIKSEFARIYNGKLKADGVGPNEQLSEAALKGYLRASMDSVKGLYPDKFSSQKASRPAAPRLKPKAVKKSLDVEKSLREYKVEGASKMNNQAAIDIYNSLKVSSPGAAETFAKNILQGNR